jgi:HK97 family phage major capsid protein
MDEETKKVVETALSAFEEFKTTNDKRLKEIETKGSADPLLEAKLAKLETSIVAVEGINQKLTLTDAQTKKVEAETKALADIVAKIESKIGRPGAGGGEDETKKKAAEYKAAFDNYLRKTEKALTADEYKALNEYKVLVASNDTLGGYYLSPAEMANEIIKAVVLQSPMRALRA